MSATTCARSGGAALYHAAADDDSASRLLRMQAEMDALASQAPSRVRVYQDQIDHAWAEHARQLRRRRS